MKFLKNLYVLRTLNIKKMYLFSSIYFLDNHKHLSDLTYIPIIELFLYRNGTQVLLQSYEKNVMNQDGTRE